MLNTTPSWLKKRLTLGTAPDETQQILSDLNLNTVCQSAMCPNQGECFEKRTATFMLMGTICTRGCQFCAVPHGKPKPLDCNEPKRVAKAAARLVLKHVVLTSVTRDDLPEGGAGQFAATINEIKIHLPGVTTEVLTPDFQGNIESLKMVLEARPDVYNHNLETVPSLYQRVRPGASYARSLTVLQQAKTLTPEIYTKSGIMVGLGEEPHEVEAVLKDLRAVGCDAITIGQYLRPSPIHLSVMEYVSPTILERYRKTALNLGFVYVAAAPFVRSSFLAEECLKEMQKGVEKI